MYKKSKQEEEAILAKKSEKQTWGFNKEQITSVVPKKKLQEYQAAFDRILKATGTKSIDELVNSFIEAEERNFTLSKYVNELA